MPLTSSVPFDQFDPHASTTSIPREIREIILEGLVDDEDEEFSEEITIPTSTEPITRNMGDITLENFQDESKEEDGPGSDAEEAVCAAAPSSSQRPQVRRRSQSLIASRASSTDRREHRRLSQSFAGFSTGVVKRQRRVSTECHYSLVLPDPEVIGQMIRSSGDLYENSDGSDVDAAANDADIRALFDL